MEGIKEILASIDINNLLKIFDIQIALAVFAIFLVGRKVFSTIIIKLYYKITKCNKVAKESSMYKPLNTFFLFLGICISVNFLPIGTQAIYVINKVFKILLIFLVFKSISTQITPDSVFLKNFFKEPGNKAINNFICKFIRVFLWMIFFVIFVNELGYNLDGLSGLVTGLGIGSAAIALAAQDLVKSLISGVVILTDKPFVIGDWIELGTYQGTVIDITFRSTRIQSFNNSIVTIPNSIITTEYVINWNKLKSRRFDCILNLSLNTTAEDIKSIVKKIKVVLENNSEVIKDTVQVSFNEISNCSSDIKIFLFVKRTDYAEFLKVKQDILCDLLEVIERENVELAYPTQTVYLKKEEEMEVKK